VYVKDLLYIPEDMMSKMIITGAGYDEEHSKMEAITSRMRYSFKSIDYYCV
jgi:hypothetical protein